MPDIAGLSLLYSHQPEIDRLIRRRIDDSLR